jgi:DNA polymerase I
MIESLAACFPVEECTFRTVLGELPGFRISAGRRVADAIELQSRHTAALYNVDIRADQKYLAEHDLFPCGHPHESRFAADVPCDLRQVTIRIRGNPRRVSEVSSIDVNGESMHHFTGPERGVLLDLISCISAEDPDVILLPDADIWMAKLVSGAKKYGLEPPFSRSGRFRRLDSRSYWSYGRVEHREGALIPDGRILIDTEQSFVYREGGLPGVLLAARLTGLSPNLASRFTPGTLVSGYEVYEAIRQGIAVPFRKSDTECVRKISRLKPADRGGMMFQPAAGVYTNVCQIDFTSLYPAIIVSGNLSPETISSPEKKGFLSGALKPLLMLRVCTKQMKKTDPRYDGIDSILKWMLVTCFGYTGYKNAKFGRIEMHEAITARSREILLHAKTLAEMRGFRVLHGIVDCLWVTGGDAALLKAGIENGTGLLCEHEHYDWIVFLPLADGFGAYNRYFGRLSDGSVKVRGIAARRHDTPEYIRKMQQAMLTCMAAARTGLELAATRKAVSAIGREFLLGLPAAPLNELAVHRRISRTSYAHRCLEGAAVQAYRDAGVHIAPGMKIRYVVRDAGRYCVDTEWDAEAADLPYYTALLQKAADEVTYAYKKGAGLPYGK